MVRAVSIALTSIALFIVAVRLGGRGLTPGQRVAAAAVIGFFILTQAATLFLGAPIISAVALIVGYAVGGQRIPWAGTLVAILVLGVLHAGKGEMREQYWSGAGPGTISVAAFPEFFAAWTAAGFREMRGAGDESRQPIYERISLMHVLLLAQGKASGPAEFLYGETYALIPKTLLPRFLDPDKPSPHDATNLLSLHYGLQTESDQQEGTMIGWGMIAEGYANFGVAGIAAVAALVGAFLGLITRITVAAPFMSLQNFLGILIMVISVQTELVMVVLVTAANLDDGTAAPQVLAKLTPEHRTRWTRCGGTASPTIGRWVGLWRGSR